jgi:serine/threonine-protein kinase
VPSIDASNRDLADRGEDHDLADLPAAPPARGAPTVRREALPLRDDEILGETIDGRWTLERLIAKGAMGAVYLARQRRLDRHVAVKLLDLEGTTDEPEILVERFHREAGILARLRHANTVRVFDAGEWRGRLYLVMEHIEGGSLKRLFSTGPVPPPRLVHVARQIAAALHEAHGLGLIHRDLKPANILLTRIAHHADVVKVVDFGLAKDCFGCAELTSEGRVLGTPMYMAPEQVRDEPSDGRADLYALGVLMFAGLTGQHPFPLGPASQVMVAHLDEPVPSFASVAPDLAVPPIVEWTVRTALAKERDARFASAVELDKALVLCLRALAGKPVPNVRLVEGSVVTEEPEASVAPPSRPDAPSTSMEAALAAYLDAVPRWVPTGLVGAFAGAALVLGVLALL